MSTHRHALSVVEQKDLKARFDSVYTCLLILLDKMNNTFNRRRYGNPPTTSAAASVRLLFAYVVGLPDFRMEDDGRAYLASEMGFFEKAGKASARSTTAENMLEASAEGATVQQLLTTANEDLPVVEGVPLAYGLHLFPSHLDLSGGAANYESGRRYFKRYLPWLVSPEDVDDPDHPQDQVATWKYMHEMAILFSDAVQTAKRGGYLHGRGELFQLASVVLCLACEAVAREWLTNVRIFTGTVLNVIKRCSLFGEIVIPESPVEESQIILNCAEINRAVQSRTNEHIALLQGQFGDALRKLLEGAAEITNPPCEHALGLISFLEEMHDSDPLWVEIVDRWYRLVKPFANDISKHLKAVGVCESALDKICTDEQFRSTPCLQTLQNVEFGSGHKVVFFIQMSMANRNEKIIPLPRMVDEICRGLPAMFKNLALNHKAGIVLREYDSATDDILSGRLPAVGFLYRRLYTFLFDLNELNKLAIEYHKWTKRNMVCQLFARLAKVCPESTSNVISFGANLASCIADMNTEPRVLGTNVVILRTLLEKYPNVIGSVFVGEGQVVDEYGMEMTVRELTSGGYEMLPKVMEAMSVVTEHIRPTADNEYDLSDNEEVETEADRRSRSRKLGVHTEH